MKKLIAALAVFATAAPVAIASSSSYVKASPNPVQSGSSTKVYGATTCGVGQTVTIFSKAFTGSTSHSYKGFPSVTTKVNSKHKFAKRVTIQSSTASGKYKLGAHCSGHTFATTHLTVN